jgi:hypothetical protein
MGAAGGLPPPISKPKAGQKIRWYREVYLKHRRHQLALTEKAAAAEG